jgi:hypothetical protein
LIWLEGGARWADGGASEAGVAAGTAGAHAGSAPATVRDAVHACPTPRTPGATSAAGSKATTATATSPSTTVRHHDRVRRSEGTAANLGGAATAAAATSTATVGGPIASRVPSAAADTRVSLASRAVRASGTAAACTVTTVAPITANPSEADLQHLTRGDWNSGEDSPTQARHARCATGCGATGTTGSTLAAT